MNSALEIANTLGDYVGIIKISFKKITAVPKITLIKAQKIGTAKKKKEKYLIISLFRDNC